MRRLFLILCGAVLLIPALGLEAGPLRDRLRARMAERAAQDRPPPGEALAYGADSLQTLTYWKAGAAKAPLVIFVHGGGWKRGDKDNATGRAKVTHFVEQGYAFASINYRLVPSATVEDQARDVASAVAWLIRNASRLGFDPGRVVLMGHSAGAHLVSLVGTDPRYLANAGLSPAALRGIIPLDGAAYDVPRQLKEGPQVMQATYQQAFGDDPQRQRALSPTLQAAAPNAPAFLILHVNREDGTAQSEALASALRSAGTATELHAIDGQGLRGHMEINRRLGEPDYPATPIVDAWLKARFSAS
jgi:arylformamidase